MALLPGATDSSIKIAPPGSPGAVVAAERVTRADGSTALLEQVSFRSMRGGALAGWAQQARRLARSLRTLREADLSAALGIESVIKRAPTLGTLNVPILSTGSGGGEVQFFSVIVPAGLLNKASLRGACFFTHQNTNGSETFTVTWRLYFGWSVISWGSPTIAAGTGPFPSFFEWTIAAGQSIGSQRWEFRGWIGSASGINATVVANPNTLYRGVSLNGWTVAAQHSQAFRITGQITTTKSGADSPANCLLNCYGAYLEAF